MDTDEIDWGDFSRISDGIDMRMAPPGLEAEYLRCVVFGIQVLFGERTRWFTLQQISGKDGIAGMASLIGFVADAAVQRSPQGCNELLEPVASELLRNTLQVLAKADVPMPQEWVFEVLLQVADEAAKGAIAPHMKASQPDAMLMFKGE